MELPLDNITCRRKKHKRANKIQSDLPQRQNNYTENEDLCTGTIQNEEEELQKELLRNHKHNHHTVDPSAKGQNDCIRYEKNPSVATDSCSYVQVVNNRVERVTTDSMKLKEPGVVLNMQDQNVKVHKKKRKLYDSQAAIVSETSETICDKNNTEKECFVDNMVGYPKKKRKKLYNSDVEVLSSEIHLPSKQKLSEINSDSGIDVQNNKKLKQVNRKGSTKNKLKNTMVAEELMDVFLNENDGCVGPETKTDSFVISSQLDNLCHGDRKQNKVNIVESNDEVLLQSKKCDQSTEGHLRKKDLLYKTPTKNSDSVEENCSRQETLHEAERQAAIESDSHSYTHHFGKVKRKRKHKNKFENHFAQGTEEFDSASCSDFPNKKNNRKKKNKGILEEVKPLQEGNSCASVNCSDLPFTKNVKKKKPKDKLQNSEHGNAEGFIDLSTDEIHTKKKHKSELDEIEDNLLTHTLEKTKNVKKKKHKDKLQNSEHGNAEGFVDLYTDEINKKKKHKSELDEIKDKLLTDALKKLRPNSVMHADSPACVNKKVEVLGSNELKADSNQTACSNILRDQKKQSHTELRKHKNHNKELDNLRAVLLSSALKSIGCKTSDSNDIHIDQKKSIDSGEKNVAKETNQSSYNKKRSHKDEERGKIKEKDMYKSEYDLNKKSSNTQNSNVDLLRKALITAAIQRIKLNEKNQRNKVLVDCSEYEVKSKHKNKKKSKVEKSVDKKSEINEMEIMRSSLISSALAKVNGTNKINKTSKIS